jgi:hypothetical protein
METILSFCSEGLSIDRRSNGVSAYNILEQIHAVGFPLAIQRIFFFCLISRGSKKEKEKYNFDFKVSLDEKILFKQKIPINFNKKLRNRIILEMGGLNIPKAGMLSFKLFHKNKKIINYTIAVKAIDKPEAKRINK